MRKTGTPEADRFLALLEPIERDLETYCRRLIWEPQEAPDALQNAVWRALAAFDRYHENASFRAWIDSELAAPSEPPPADKPKSARPGPRSDRRLEILNA